jgi:uncharacterized membrane protein YidH (DUF202 family)
VIRLQCDSERYTEQEGVHMKVTGLILIVIGVIALAYGGITYTRREKVLDIGPIEATAERRETVPLPPVLGVVALAGGIVLMIAGSRRK